ncbi:hypothetical protein FQA39_LY18975 [Lamprigera yunnana]|nr:hypothetical protein FQA39_LY18975 [Lamprigera yunnana]
MQSLLTIMLMLNYPNVHIFQKKDGFHYAFGRAEMKKTGNRRPGMEADAVLSRLAYDQTLLKEIFGLKRRSDSTAVAVADSAVAVDVYAMNRKNF